MAVCRMTKGNWPGARDSMQAALGNLRETGDLAGAVDAMTAMGVILIELGEMAQAAGFLREAITEARRIGYGQGEIYGAWTVAFLACRHGLHRDAAAMDDALAEHIGIVERGLPRSIFLDYVKSIETSRVAAGLPAGSAPGRPRMGMVARSGPRDRHRDQYQGRGRGADLRAIVTAFAGGTSA